MQSRSPSGHRIPLLKAAPLLFLLAAAPFAAAEDAARPVPPAGDAGQPAGDAGSRLGDETRKMLTQSLEGLSGDRRARASAIVSASLPALQDLDARIAVKMDELKELTYSGDADPEALPRLGMDLQALRNELNEALRQVNAVLLRETGAQLKVPAGRGVRSMRGLDVSVPDEEPAASAKAEETAETAPRDGGAGPDAGDGTGR